jgi:ethylmalonyl-CoA/methylmalonyl-CoA decarboxylase
MGGLATGGIMDARWTEGLATAVAELRALEDRVAARPGQVRLTTAGPVAWLSLDNPRAHNAFTVSMMRQLAEAVLSLSRWDGAFVAIASAHGGTFCSGGHLTQVREALVHPEAAAVMSASMQLALDVLLALPLVSVAVLEGAAIGGGAELATATDLRIGTPDATVHFAQVGLGVACGWGGAGRLVGHVGRPSALRLLVASEVASAEQALDLGFFDAISGGGREDMLRAAVGAALDHPPSAVRAAKAQVVAAGDPAAQRDAFLSVWGGGAHLASLGAGREG